MCVCRCVCQCQYVCVCVSVCVGVCTYFDGASAEPLALDPLHWGWLTCPNQSISSSTSPVDASQRPPKTLCLVTSHPNTMLGVVTSLEQNMN